MELRKLLSLLILGSVYLESQAEILLLSTLDELWTVDTSNGQLTQLGVLPVGGKEIQELAQDPGGGYWAVASNVLYSVDP